MLEEVMSVWPKQLNADLPLSSREGSLVSVSITVDPRYLESLLEALAQVDFPVNPQIYHDARLVTVHAGGGQESESITLVEFPAWAARLDQVRTALARYGFDASRVHVTNMLDEIQESDPGETAPEGAPYVRRYLIKSVAASQVH
jgi:hypothetical protein